MNTTFIIADPMLDVTPKIDMHSATRLIQSILGQENSLTVPRTLLDLLDGDFPAAILLSQCVYWQGKTDAGKCGTKDGYFWVSQKDWRNQIGLSEYQVRMATKRLEKMKLLQTKIKKAWSLEAGDKVRRVHYRVNMDNLLLLLFSLVSKESIPEKLQNPSFKNSRIDPQEIGSTSQSPAPTKITYKDNISNSKGNATPDPQKDQKEIQKQRKRARLVGAALAEAHPASFAALDPRIELGLLEGIARGLGTGLGEMDLLALGHYSCRDGVNDPINYFLRGVTGGYGQDPAVWTAKSMSREEKATEKKLVVDLTARRLGIPPEMLSPPASAHPKTS